MITVGDIHLEKNELEPFVEFQLMEINRMVDYAIEHKEKVIWIAGDMLDKRQVISVKTIKILQDIFDKIAEHDIKVIYTLGNHDSFYKNTNDLNSIDLLLRDYKNVLIVSTSPQHYIVEGVDCLFVPWITTENYDECVKVIKESTAKYCFGHFEINGFELVRGNECKEGLRQSLFKKFERVFSGHFHLKGKQGNIEYIGSLIQLDRNDIGDIKGFYSFSPKNNKLEFIQNTKELFIDIVIDDNFTFDNIEQYYGTIPNIIFNRKLTKKEDMAYSILLENLMKKRVIDNTFILENAGGDVIDAEKEDVIDITRQYLREQEKCQDESFLVGIEKIICSAHERLISSSLTI